MQQELARINRSCGRPLVDTRRPSSEEELLSRLWVARYAEGIGYDCISMQGSALHRVEVKSCAGPSLRIHLSDAERRMGCWYMTDPSFSREQWSLVVVRGDGQLMDVSDQITPAMLQWRQPASILRPTSFVADLP